MPLWTVHCWVPGHTGIILTVFFQTPSPSQMRIQLIEAPQPRYSLLLAQLRTVLQSSKLNQRASLSIPSLHPPIFTSQD